MNNTAILSKELPKAKKSLGQHFLKSTKVLEEIIKASEITHKDCVLEIGPGQGALTDYLVEAKPGKLILVEKDSELIENLKEKYGGYDFVEIIDGDILKSRIELPAEYKVVANIPYYISTPILKHFLLREEYAPALMTLLVQKEFAEKIMSTSPHASAISNTLQLFFSPVKVCDVPKGAFTPPPKVDSAVVVMRKLEVNKETSRKAVRMLERCFLQARKKLRNSIDKSILNMNNTVELSTKLERLCQQRPEELSVEDWNFLITIQDEHKQRDE